MAPENTVSVILACYNGELYIERQLLSLANQTHLPFELIISDDGSNDKTISIINEVVPLLPFKVIINQNSVRLGYGENFLLAAKRAKGKFIAFCDQDDIWLPEKIERGVEELERTGADLYVHKAKITDQFETIIGSLSQNISGYKIHLPLTMPPWGVFYGFTMMFRRSLFELVAPERRGRHTFEFKGSLSHDLWLYFLATSLGKVLTDDRYLALYRRHSSNQTPDLFGNWQRKLSSYFGPPGNQNLRRDLIASDRAMLLVELAQNENCIEKKDSILRAARYWSDLSVVEKNRISIYSNPRIVPRIVGLAKVLTSGGYASASRGGLGWRLLVRDFVSGVIRFRRKTV